MLVAFLESFKYIGHLIPVACLRIFLGGLYIRHAWSIGQSDYLGKAYLAELIRAHLPISQSPEWYKSFLENIVIPHWQAFAVTITGVHWFLGASYVLGYLVRPAAVLGVILSAGFIGALGQGVTLAPMPAPLGETIQATASLQATTTMLMLHLVLGWVGAGRCLGIDYYFYKRHRGIWW